MHTSIVPILLISNILPVAISAVKLDEGPKLGRRGLDLRHEFSLASPMLAPFMHGAAPMNSIVPRQSCASGNKVCGYGCIPNSYTCCSDGLGGCPSTSYCVTLGCCPDGEICGGYGSGCNAGEKDCGEDCVPNDGGTCCPDQSGCLINTYCYLESPGTYGCCISGDDCGGAAAVSSATGANTIVSTRSTTFGSYQSTSLPDVATFSTSASYQSTSLPDIATLSTTTPLASTRISTTSTTIRQISTTTPAAITASSTSNSGDAASQSVRSSEVRSWPVVMQFLLTLCLGLIVL